VRGKPSGRHIIIVGLGNPGRAFSMHRHNLGFMVVERLAADESGVWTVNTEKTQVCEIKIDGQPVVLAKPQTYMNLSGKAVAPLSRRLNADPAWMIVVHDDLDLAAGTVRVKIGGGDGGHKGIRSIADSLRFRDFVRIRLGIGRPPQGVSPEEFVLTSLGPDERPLVDDLVWEGARAVRLVVTDGVERAQHIVHTRKSAPEGRTVADSPAK